MVFEKQLFKDSLYFIVFTNTLYNDEVNESVYM